MNGCLADLARWLLSPPRGTLPHHSAPHIFDSLALEDFWIYASYKYMAELFAAHPEAVDAVDWSRYKALDRKDHVPITPHAQDILILCSLGIAGSGAESTFWFGSTGSQTACHYDTYGVNYVTQVFQQFSRNYITRSFNF